MDDFKAALDSEVLRRFFSSSDTITKRQIHLHIVSDIANLLQVPPHQQNDDIKQIITLSPEVQKWMDDAWKDLQISWKLTSKEKAARENVEGKNTVSVSDLVKYFHVLIHKNTIRGKCNDREGILKKRNINAFLAVDGFCGFLPKDFKNYIGNLQYPLTDHVKAVRNMYRHLKRATTTGTDTACLIFLALFKVYLKVSEHILDKTAKHVTHKVRQYVEMFLQKQAQYYTDINPLLLQTDALGKEYVNSLEDKNKLENLAVNQMMKLVQNAPKLFSVAKKNRQTS